MSLQLRRAAVSARGVPLRKRSRPDDRIHHTPPHPPPAGRQPLRDCDPGVPRGDRARHSDGRDLRRGGQALPPPVQGRRGLPGRPRQGAARGLSRHRRGDPGRGRPRGGCDPPRLRLPLGEPRIRRSLRRGRDHLHRPDARDHAHAGQQGGGAQSRRGGRGPGDAGNRTAARRSGHHPPARGRDRLSGDAQGFLGRRRARHAADRARGAAAGCRPRRQTRGQGRLRQGRGLPRKAGQMRPARRGPAAGRHPRQPGPPVRARLHHPAPPPEGDRAGAGPLSRRGSARRPVRGRAQDRPRHPLLSAPARSSS